MSSPERPDAKAFIELEALVRNLGEELAAFRKRAHAAEAALKTIEAKGGGSDARAEARAEARVEERVAQLEAENARLRHRVDAAADRTRKMLERVRFLRQQHGAGEPR